MLSNKKICVLFEIVLYLTSETRKNEKQLSTAEYDGLPNPGLNQGPLDLPSYAPPKLISKYIS